MASDAKKVREDRWDLGMAKDEVTWEGLDEPRPDTMQSNVLLKDTAWKGGLSTRVDRSDTRNQLSFRNESDGQQ